MERLKSGPHRKRTPYTVDVCDTCMYFIEYGTTGDASARGMPSTDQMQRDARHAQSMVAHLGVTLEHVVNGCGRECEDHGEAAYDSPEDYMAALEERDTDTWFSSSPCDACGAEAGTRQHATIFVR